MFVNVIQYGEGHFKINGDHFILSLQCNSMKLSLEFLFNRIWLFCHGYHLTLVIWHMMNHCYKSCTSMNFIKCLLFIPKDTFKHRLYSNGNRAQLEHWNLPVKTTPKSDDFWDILYRNNIFVNLKYYSIQYVPKSITQIVTSNLFSLRMLFQ